MNTTIYSSSALVRKRFTPEKDSLIREKKEPRKIKTNKNKKKTYRFRNVRTRWNI